MGTRKNRRASAALEHLMLVASVAVLGAVGLARWGTGARDAVAAEASSSRPSSMVTSQQAASVEAMAKVATDLSFLADDVRAVRTGSWAKPMHAFGDAKNELQFALEKEGNAEAIGDLYRPRHVSARAWDSLPEDIRSSPGSGFVHWDDYVRRRGTPKSLAKHLQSEDGGLWEITSEGYQNTLDALFGDATFLDDVLGPGGYHWHISFQHQRAMTHAVTQYWRHVDEYLKLRAIFTTPDGLRHNFLRPVEDYQYADMRRLLRKGEVSGSDDEKYHFVGLRTGIYGKDNRIGLEIRGAGDDLSVSARVVRATTGFLADPERARFHLHKGAKSYGLDDITRPKETAIRKPQGDRHPRHMTLYGERALPYVRWEQRPWLAPYKAEIRAAREQYTDAIHDLPFGASVEDALTAWAQTLRLHEHY